MADFMSLTKVRREADFTELTVEAGNSVISASATIYVTKAILEDLQEQIGLFLQETDLEGYWENDVPGIGGPPCVTIKMLPQKENQQVLLEIYMELNDGGSFMEHNCRFFVRTDRADLRQFQSCLSDLIAAPDGTMLKL